VGGGVGNTASGYIATIAGGYHNVASGDYSFAAGHQAQALHDGCIIWADLSSTNAYSSTGVNQFKVRAAGGTRINSNASATTGVLLPPGGSTWLNGSDRNLKENFKSVDARAVLDRVAHMPVTEWNLKSQDPSIRHIGPMAEDFQAAVGVGEDNKFSGTTDADGVAFAAIQGLYQMVEEQKQSITDRDKQIGELRAQLAELKDAIIQKKRE
jgi:hypothetical protein